MSTTIELTGDSLAKFNAYKEWTSKERKSFDALKADRDAAIDAISAACRKGGKVNVTKEEVAAFLKKEGATELRKAICARLWPEPKDSSKKPSRKIASLADAQAKAIADAIESVCRSKEERKAFFTALSKAVEKYLELSE